MLHIESGKLIFQLPLGPQNGAIGVKVLETTTLKTSCSQKKKLMVSIQVPLNATNPHAGVLQLLFFEMT